MPSILVPPSPQTPSTLPGQWPLQQSLPSLESCVAHLLAVLLLGTCPVFLHLDKESCEKKDAVISCLDPTQLAWFLPRL